MERGRTLSQHPRAANPLERAESRDRIRDATIELDGRSIFPTFSQRNLFFEDRNDLYSILDDALLEPRPHGLMHRTVSEVMGTPVFSQQNELNALWGHGSFAEKNASILYPIHPSETRAPLQACLAGDQKSLQSTISHAPHPEPKLLDYMTPTSTPPLQECRISIAANLPLEIQHQIYLYLNPTDFESARHVCHAWYTSSLERSLLEIMLRRGGWSSHIKNEFSPNYPFESQARANNEWFMSKRLARECALGPDWKGSGLDFMGETAAFDHHRLSLKLRKTPLVRTSTTDFTKAGAYYPGAAKGDLAISFTVSSCGNVLMVSQGCLVMIYELNRNENQDWESGSLRPVTSVVCPKRVLACSMDTSSHRYAIAVLLDGRIGLVCDISGFSKSSRRPRFSSQPSPVSRGGSQQSIYFKTPMNQKSLYHSTDNICTIPTATSPVHTRHSLRAERNSWQDDLHADGTGGLGDYQPDEMRPTILFRNSYPIAHHNNQGSKLAEPSAPTIYAPLCSADDPPRTVALCPQRRCVAFGCSSGIELHWIDALTGQDLSRWFPLGAPSDYLYFLPPRVGIDNAKKLRLISSARHPGEWSDISNRSAGRVDRSDPGNRGRHSQLWDAISGRHSVDWAALGAMASDGSGMDTNKHNGDHYRAVPLSDGYHVLFTDPASGMLCLGSDASTGGPNKLLRKIRFAGQKGQGPPVSYVGGSDLKCGVRVVAAYGIGLEQSIWLFSVPADIFAASLTELGIGSLPFAGISSPIGELNREWMEWRSDAGFQDRIDPGRRSSDTPILRKERVWPVQIRGQEIGKSRGLVDLAIDSGPEMTIWAFSREGVAQTWQIDDGSLDGTVRKRFVIRDGTIREGDADGNIEMRDRPYFPVEEPSPFSPPEPQTLNERAFDGAALVPRNGRVPGYSFMVDADGDVIMSDVP